jgi:hypothetical protein
LLNQNQEILANELLLSSYDKHPLILFCHYGYGAEHQEEKACIQQACG